MAFTSPKCSAAHIKGRCMKIWDHRSCVGLYFVTDDEGRQVIATGLSYQAACRLLAAEVTRATEFLGRDKRAQKKDEGER